MRRSEPDLRRLSRFDFRRDSAKPQKVERFGIVGKWRVDVLPKEHAVVRASAHARSPAETDLHWCAHAAVGQPFDERRSATHNRVPQSIQ